MELVSHPFPPSIEYVTGRYYASAGLVATSAALTNSQMRCMPFYLPTQRTIDRIGIETTVDGEAGSLVRLGVYDGVSGQTYPGALLLDAGTVAGDGGAAFKEKTISLAVGPGIIWLAAACQSAPATQPTLRIIGGNDYMGLIGRLTGGTLAQSFAYFQTAVTGAFPATFSAGATHTFGILVSVRFA